MKNNKVYLANNLPAPKCLPSDCRNREDILWLRRDDLNNSESFKHWLEELQRYDGKLRKK